MSALPMVWCELVCGMCCATTSGEWTRERPRIFQMFEDAKREGWRMAGDDIVCSEECERTYTANNKAGTDGGER